MGGVGGRNDVLADVLTPVAAQEESNLAIGHLLVGDLRGAVVHAAKDVHIVAVADGQVRRVAGDDVGVALGVVGYDLTREEAVLDGRRVACPSHDRGAVPCGGLLLVDGAGEDAVADDASRGAATSYDAGRSGVACVDGRDVGRYPAVLNEATEHFTGDDTRLVEACLVGAADVQVLHRAVQIAEEAVAGLGGYEVHVDGVILSVEGAGVVASAGAHGHELVLISLQVDVCSELAVDVLVTLIYHGSKPDHLLSLCKHIDAVLVGLYPLGVHLVAHLADAVQEGVVRQCLSLIGVGHGAVNEHTAAVDVTLGIYLCVVREGHGHGVHIFAGERLVHDDGGLVAVGLEAEHD